MPHAKGRTQRNKDRLERARNEAERGIPSPRTVRRAGLAKAPDGVCGVAHPTRGFMAAGQLWQVQCQRPTGHKVQHRAKVGGGYVWWS